MILSVSDRISLLSILPAKGDLITLKVLMTLRMSLACTEEEIAEWGISEKGGRVSWENNGVAEIPIGEVATGILVDELRKLEKKKELPYQMLELYEKFIPAAD